MLVSSKSREQAGSFVGLVQVGGTKGSLLFKLLEEAYSVIWFEDSLAFWRYGTRLLIQTPCVRAFAVDQVVKKNQMYVSFVIDLNEWNPAEVVSIAATVLKVKALKLGNCQLLFLKIPFWSYLILSCLVFCLW